VKPRTRWLVIALIVVVVGGLAAAAVAFGGGDGGNNSSTGSGANGTSSGATSSPSPNGTAPCTMDPSFDYGQVICITGKGTKPNWLVSLQNKPITWQNETSKPVTVTFVGFKVASGPIPPHGTWSYTPKLPLSFAYHISSGTRLGRIQVLAPES
jgi:hypothetical protein